MSDAHNLQRFVDAQEGVFPRVLAELAAGEKRSHWIWFVFPQIRGLGYSATAERYAIASRDEAAAYAAHDVLGPRLRQCTQLVLDVEGRSAAEVFGHPDDWKFRSSMTLFTACAEDGTIFRSALEKYFAGAPDQRTLDILGQGHGAESVRGHH